MLAGTDRISVSLILDYLASGASIEKVLEAYPSIEREDVLACVAYAAETTNGSETEKFTD